MILNLETAKVSRGKYIKAESFKYAFIKTIPIMFSYLFLSMAFGISMHEAGFDTGCAYITSAFIYTGTFQFMLIPFLSSKTTMLTVVITALFMNSRFMFYGLAYVEKFRDMGKKYLYMIFSITDETYSLNSSIKFNERIDEKQTLFYIALLSRFYWIVGTLIGSTVGDMIPIKLKGIEFCLTALIVTIFMDQWHSFKTHIPSLAGLIISFIFLILFGGTRFILPSLATCIVVLVMMKSAVSKRACDMHRELCYNLQL